MLSLLDGRGEENQRATDENDIDKLKAKTMFASTAVALAAVARAASARESATGLPTGAAWRRAATSPPQVQHGGGLRD